MSNPCCSARIKNVLKLRTGLFTIVNYFLRNVTLIRLNKGFTFYKFIVFQLIICGKLLYMGTFLKIALLCTSNVL